MWSFFFALLQDIRQISEPVVEACYLAAGSFTIVASVTTTLLGGITTLFGLLMWSYRSRIEAAEEREQRALDERNKAIDQRNEAIWRMNETRKEYRDFVERGPSLPGWRRGPGD